MRGAAHCLARSGEMPVDELGQESAPVLLTITPWHLSGLSHRKTELRAAELEEMLPSITKIN